MTEKDYIKSRLDDQLKWHEEKAKANKRLFRGLKIFELTFSVAIPVLSGLAATRPEDRLYLLIGILGSLIALLSGVQGLSRFFENWIQYRFTAESLKREKLFYDTRTGPYAMSRTGRDPFPELVERVENILSDTNEDWRKYVSRSTEPMKK